MASPASPIRAYRRAWLWPVLSAGLLGGCGPLADEEGGPPSTEENPLVGGNGLTINGLTTNGLTTNGLAINGLTINGLAINGLAPSSLAALRDPTPLGATTRRFFRYLVSCALPAGSNQDYTWTDASGVAHRETAGGQFNLAPGWEHGAVDVAGQELVSACLFARTNARGLSVPISIRGDGPRALAVTEQERTDFHFGEGAFWGNLFAATPAGYSCSRAPFGAGAPTSEDLQNGRVCARQNCGVIRYVGPCYRDLNATTGQACFRRAANNDWVADCSATMSDAGALNAHVITTWLRSGERRPAEASRSPAQLRSLYPVASIQTARASASAPMPPVTARPSQGDELAEPTIP